MSKEMPCGHTWAEFVSCDNAGGSFMCGVCEPIGMRVAQLLAERNAFKLLLELSTKPVDVTQAEVISAHQIVQAVEKAEKDAEKDLSASEALEQIGEIPGVQEAYKTKEEKYLDEQIKKVMEHGPRRVMINSSGEAISPMRAKRDHNIVPDVVFIRNDGWSLGAPNHLVGVARALWSDLWIGSFKPQDHVDSEV